MRTSDADTPRKTRRDLALLLAVCAVAFWWQLGRLGLADPDEPFYAQTAREMIARREWLVPHIFGQPQFEKPILYYWLTIASYQVFGISEFAGRFMPALFATLLVLMTWAFARRHVGARAALLASLVLATSVECVALSRLMLTDVVFAVFVCGSIFALWHALEDERRRRMWLLLHGAASGLAMLTKGPLASCIVVVTLASFFFLMRRRSPFRWRDVALSTGVFLLVAGPWYAFMLARFGRVYFDQFFVHENWERIVSAEHESSNHVWYYPVVLLVGSIPWIAWIALHFVPSSGDQPSTGRTFLERSVLMFARVATTIRAEPLRAFLWCWLVAGLAFMTVVQSKLPTYIFFLFVPFALLVGQTIDEVLTRGFLRTGERWTFLVAGCVQALVLGVAPFLMPEHGSAFTVPMLVAAGILLVSVAVQFRRATVLGIACTAAAPCALIVLLLAVSAPEIEDMTSVRGAANELVRRRSADEPIVTDRILARGVAFYTQSPVTVLASKRNPYWTPHPLPILVGTDEFQSFLKLHGPVWCLMKAKEFSMTGAGQSADDGRYFGGKIIQRLEKP